MRLILFIKLNLKESIISYKVVKLSLLDNEFCHAYNHTFLASHQPEA